MVIHVDENELNQQASMINAWGEELKSTVTTSATQRQNEIDGMSFDGQAAAAFKASFEEMKTQIIQQIESITDGQIAGIGERLRQIGVSMTEVDQRLAQY